MPRKKALEAETLVEITTVRKSPRKRKPKVQDDGAVEKPKPRKLKKNVLDDVPDLSRQSPESDSFSRTKSSKSDLKSKLITEAEIMAAQSPAQLTSLVNSLVSTQQDQIFADYRQTTQLQQISDSKLISSLRQQLETKQNTIDALAAQLLEIHRPNLSSTPQRGVSREMYESPIRKQASLSLMVHRDDMDTELKTISFTFDMLELLTGVRIVNYEDDSEKFYFDVKQSSTVLEPEVDAVYIEYRLVIDRQFESTAEVTYVPVFLNELAKKARDAEQELRNRDARKLVPFLPGYLQDNLKFPYNTLSQFYTKLSKALNRSAKS